MRLALFILSLSVGCATSASYYISSSGGNDSNAGNSSGSPWRTLSNANFHVYSAGDSILLNQGDTFYGPLLVTNAGSAGSLITLASYGSGARPIIYGDHPEAVWGAATGFPGFFTNRPIATAANIQYLYDGTGSNYVAKANRLSTSYATWLGTFTNTYCWGQDNQTRVFYVKTADSNAPVGLHMFDSYVVRLSGGYSAIKDLEVSSGGIALSVGGPSCLISNNIVHDCNSIGIELNSSWDSEVVSNLVCNSGYTMIYVIHPGGHHLVHYNQLLTNSSIILSNVNLAVQHPELNGVGLLNCTNNLVEHNTIRYMAGGFFDWYYEQNTEVRYNDCFNGGAGSPDGSGLSVHHNVLNVNEYGSGNGIIGSHHWLDANQIPGDTGNVLIWNNLVYNFTGNGLSMTGTNGVGVIYRNNIFVTSTAYAGGGLASYRSGVDSDYNLFLSSVNPKRWFFNATNIYYTLETLYAATGLEQHSIYGDAGFIVSNPTTALDFRLSLTSTGLNTAQNMLSAGWISATNLYSDYLGVPIPIGSGPDMGAFESGFRYGRINNLNKR